MDEGGALYTCLNSLIYTNSNLLTQPFSAIMTPPTAAERTGDYSRSGNRIPAGRMDPAAMRFMQDIWLPNGSGDDATGANNFKGGYVWFLKYLNISHRTDWNVSDKWKVFGALQPLSHHHRPEQLHSQTLLGDVER
jgi:hypothetical protein